MLMSVREQVHFCICGKNPAILADGNRSIFRKGFIFLPE